MVQPEHLCSSTIRSLSISACNAHPIQRAEAKSFCTLAAARSKIYRRFYFAWQLHRSVSCASSVGDFAGFYGELRWGFRPNIKGGREHGGTRFRKSSSTAGGGL